MLRNKKALVTGGTAGIGKEIARVYASQGASVVIFGTHQERAEHALREIESFRCDPSQRFSYKLLDVSDKSSVDEAVHEVISSLGCLDILVNNAGITRDRLLMKMEEEAWDRVIAVNLKSVYTMSQAVIRTMMKARSGRIINISSVVGLMGNAGQTNYAAAKAGMIGMTKALAKEVASRGVTVNCVAPGFIQTSMTEALTEDQRNTLQAQIPMGRLGTPHDVAQAALFLASPMAEYITGQVMTVDGGMVM